jgi:hypothetical protein
MSSKEVIRVTKSLTRIAIKHELNKNDLLKSISKALDKGTSECGELAITCREKTKESAIFLFESEKELYQFPIPLGMFHPIHERRRTHFYYR